MEFYPPTSHLPRQLIIYNTVMNRFIKRFGACLLGCSLLLLAGCRLSEDLDNCNTFGIHFVYDYNLKYVDLFPKEATKMNLYAFDESGSFVQEFTSGALTSFSPNYNMQITLPAGQAYTFIAWSGVYPGAYTVERGLGTSSLSDLKLQLAELAQKETSQDLPDLWYGRLRSTVEGNKVDTISLVKNTKTILIAFQLLPNAQSSRSLVKEDYHVWIEAADGVYDSDNTPSGSVINYRPYHSENNDKGFVLELNTLRLMADAKSYLVVERASDKKELLRLDLTEYFNIIRMKEYQKLPIQEYLDRQDEYELIFIFGGQVGTDDMFNSVSLIINDWIIRDNGPVI